MITYNNMHNNTKDIYEDSKHDNIWFHVVFEELYVKTQYYNLPKLV